MKISGTIITLNAEKSILRAVESLKLISNEVIVLDSESEDTTREIAESAGAKVYIQPFLGDGPQKREASKYASNDWIFSLDADESLDKDLINYVNNIKNIDDNYDSFAFRRKNFCGDEWIKAAGFYPDYVTRLYNKTRVNYNQRVDHASVQSKHTITVKSHIIHNTYESMEEWVDKLNYRSTLSAKELFTNGVKPSTFRPIGSAFWAFFKKLIISGGIFQGKNGFRVAIATMFNTYLKYIKLNDLYKK